MYFTLPASSVVSTVKSRVCVCVRVRAPHSHLLHGANGAPAVAHPGLESRRPGRRQVFVGQDHEVRDTDSFRHVRCGRREASRTETKRRCWATETSESGSASRTLFPLKSSRGGGKNSTFPEFCSDFAARSQCAGACGGAAARRAIVRPARGGRGESEGANSIIIIVVIITWECEEVQCSSPPLLPGSTPNQPRNRTPEDPG